MSETKLSTAIITRVFIFTYTTYSIKTQWDDVISSIIIWCHNHERQRIFILLLLLPPFHRRVINKCWGYVTDKCDSYQINIYTVMYPCNNFI